MMLDPSSLLGFGSILMAGCVLVGILVFIHESGHYAVAKLLGIRVEVFSLGFGPKLLKLNRGGTEYCVSAIPLGGYVKMLGENPDEELRGGKEEFLSRSKFERFLVLVMGATLNIILAVVLTAGTFMYGVPEPHFWSESPTIGWIDPDAAAQAAGLKPGDTIVMVGDQKVTTWRELQLQVAFVPNRTVDFEILRDGRSLTIPIAVGATKREGYGIIGIGSSTLLSIEEVAAGSPADLAGVIGGDLIEATELTRIATILSSGPENPVEFRVTRGEELLYLELPAGSGGEDQETGLSAAFPTTIRRYGPFQAFKESLKQNWRQTGALFVVLKKLVSRQISPRTLSGPIEIFRLAGESLNAGWTYYLSLMAFISLQLGIINLLPIPILDGGHIFILGVESLMRRDLSMRIKERVMQFGFILLLLFMGGVIYLDVYKTFFIQ